MLYAGVVIGITSNVNIIQNKKKSQRNMLHKKGLTPNLEALQNEFTPMNCIDREITVTIWQIG